MRRGGGGGGGGAVLITRARYGGMMSECGEIRSAADLGLGERTGADGRILV